MQYKYNQLSQLWFEFQNNSTMTLTTELEIGSSMQMEINDSFSVSVLTEVHILTFYTVHVLIPS